MEGLTKFWINSYIIIGILIWIFGIIRGIKEKKISIGLIFENTIISFVCSLIVTFIIYLISFVGVNMICDREYKQDWNTYIISLEDSNNTYVTRNGAKDGYRYNYAINTDLGKTPRYLEDYSGSRVHIKDILDKDHIRDARIETWSKHFKNPIVEKIFQNPDYAVSQDMYWVIYVPTGTFKENFNIDLK